MKKIFNLSNITGALAFIFLIMALGEWTSIAGNFICAIVFTALAYVSIKEGGYVR